MEIEDYKSAWNKRPVEDPSLSSPGDLSRSMRFLRASSIRDLQKSQELSRVVLNLLFALLLIGASVEVMITTACQVAALLFALALITDAASGLALMVRRFRRPATETMREFISREHRQLENCRQYERYSLRIMLVLGGAMLLILIFGPRPAAPRMNALDAFSRMAMMTAFLAVAWRRSKSRSGELRRELERYMEDLQTQ